MLPITLKFSTVWNFFIDFPRLFNNFPPSFVGFHALDFCCLRLTILLIQICQCHSVSLLPSTSCFGSRRYQRGSLKMKKSCHIMWEKERFSFYIVYILSGFLVAIFFCILDRHKNSVGIECVRNGTYFMHCWYGTWLRRISRIFILKFIASFNSIHGIYMNISNLKQRLTMKLIFGFSQIFTEQFEFANLRIQYKCLFYKTKKSEKIININLQSVMISDLWSLHMIMSFCQQ